MSSARRPLPTDLIALVSFDGRVYPNEAKPLDQLGLDERAHPLETALEQWFSFATGKHTWVNVRGATIRGLISARRRAKPSAWEVEAIIDADEDKGIALTLFSRMVADITKRRAERIFLRLDAESSVFKTAREAGFFPYAKETLFQRKGKVAIDLHHIPLRPRIKSDLFGIFQLYGNSAPANVRAIEGATFREWQAAQETWGGRPTELLLEEDGIISAWVRLATGRVGRFSIMTASSRVGIDELVRACLARLSQSRRIQALVRDDNLGLVRSLLDAGFEPAGSYVALAKRLVKPAEELSPESASTAVPAG
jgi:hypothetical protein